jgi:hypothetical protein
VNLVLLIPFCACFLLFPSFPQVYKLKHFLEVFQLAKKNVLLMGFYNSWGKNLIQSIIKALCSHIPDLICNHSTGMGVAQPGHSVYWLQEKETESTSDVVVLHQTLKQIVLVCEVRREGEKLEGGTNQMIRQVLSLWRPGQRNCIGIVLRGPEAVIYNFTKTDAMTIDKVSVCKLFDEVYKLALTLGFLLHKNKAIPQ